VQSRIDAVFVRTAFPFSRFCKAMTVNPTSSAIPTATTTRIVRVNRVASFRSSAAVVSLSR
jgi:hypothetical protein